MHQELGGDAARTAGPNWPEPCPIPYGVVLKIGTERVGQSVAATTRGLSGHHHSVGSEQLHCASPCIHPGGEKAQRDRSSV